MPRAAIASPHVYNEFDPLREVVLCPPRYMEIKEVINKTQRQYAKENIDQQRALAQHQSLVETLKTHGVEVILLSPQPQFPEQVFTRDIGFALGDNLFVAQLDRKIRQGEEQVLSDWLDEEGISYQEIREQSIEGGDVLIHGDTVYIGCSHRTSDIAIKELRRKLDREYEIITIPFPGEYLHLDCVFNIVSPREALVYVPALEKKELDLLSSRYEFIEVSEEEQFTLGTNVVCLGNNKILSLPVNKQVNRMLKERGYTVIEVDISEIIKSGGAFRCITMPLLRD